MKATIIINMNNAAFEDNGHGEELAGIVGKLESEIIANGNLYPGLTYSLKDSNGNTVGTLKITRD